MKTEDEKQFYCAEQQIQCKEQCPIQCLGCKEMK